MACANQWYVHQYEAGDPHATIKLLHHPENRYWAPQVLSQYPLPSSIQAPRILVEGPGSVWMYAHVGAWAGALRIPLEVKVIHQGGSGNLSNCQRRLVPREDSQAFLEVNLPRAVPIAPSEIDALIGEIVQELHQRCPRTLVIGGRASVKVYARLAHAAVMAGAERIACWSARDGLVLVFPLKKSGEQFQRPQWLTQLVQPKHSTIWGVIGDPHRGKSIFSEVLLNCLEKKGVTSWKLDCDGASPTPPWFAASSEDPEVQKQREELKLPWTPQMESTIADHLRQGRDLFEVLIADLPGGNHKVHPPDRIPSSRKEMFSQIDKFILLTDAEGVGEQGWRSALQKHGLHQQLAAVLVSADPQDEPSFHLEQEEPILRGRVTGLDRNRDPSDIAEAIGLQVDRLLKSLLSGEA